MNKKINILVFFYSQTERTKKILDIFLKPLKSHSSVHVDMVQIEPETPFPFPWPKLYFFSIMPETVYERPMPLKEFRLRKDAKYDFIILGCQVWFLSPSLPISSLLQHPDSAVFSNTPVIILLTCRKMWSQALEAIEQRLKAINTWAVERIVVTAEGSQMQTLKRTKDNLFVKQRKDKLGNQDKAWKASAEEIESVKQKGREFAQLLESDQWDPKGSIFKEPSPAMTGYREFPEQIAKKNFRAWGKFIIKYSEPRSMVRSLFTVIFSVIFLVRTFIGLPLVDLYFKNKIFKRKGENQ